MTAISIWIVRAIPAPAHTANGRLNRAANTIVASIVLSGSSATKIVPKAATTAAGCTGAESTGHRAADTPWITSAA